MNLRIFIYIRNKHTKKLKTMEYLRKQAIKRVQEIRAERENQSHKNTTPQPKRRVKMDEIHAEMVERYWQDVEDKMIDLSKWNGEGSPYHYRELESAENYYNP